MSITENERLDLRAKFEEVLGPRLAEIAMEAMPPLDYDQFATKQDVANLGIELRGELALTESRLSAEIGGLRSETVTEFAGMRSEIGSLRSDFDRQFRQYFFANLAVMLTMLGLVVGLT